MRMWILCNCRLARLIISTAGSVASVGSNHASQQTRDYEYTLGSIRSRSSYRQWRNTLRRYVESRRLFRAERIAVTHTGRAATIRGTMERITELVRGRFVRCISDAGVSRAIRQAADSGISGISSRSDEPEGGRVTRPPVYCPQCGKQHSGFRTFGGYMADMKTPCDGYDCSGCGRRWWVIRFQNEC